MLGLSEQEKMIQVQKLQKEFKGRIAVKNLSFEAPDAAITGLLGSNGAGKTTTLRMICGVLKPDAGVISVDDTTQSTDVLARQHRLGALLDHIGIYFRLTVRENLWYFGKLRGLTAEVIETRVKRTMSVLGLQSIADRRACGLSQGERMKTALARAVIHSPNNLLLDEPTNGLDVPTVRSLREFLRQLRDAGICIVFSTHVLDEVQRSCDNVVVISRGVSVAHGSPDQICRRTNTGSIEDAFVKLVSEREKYAC